MPLGTSGCICKNSLLLLPRWVEVVVPHVLRNIPCLVRIRSNVGRFGARRAGDLRAVRWQHRVVEGLRCWAGAPERTGVCALSEQCNLADDPRRGNSDGAYHQIGMVIIVTTWILARKKPSNHS